MYMIRSGLLRFASGALHAILSVLHFIGQEIQMKKEMKYATAAALLGNSVFGFSFMFSRVALGIAQPFVMLMYRFIGAFLGLNLLALWSRLSGAGFKSEGEKIHFMRFDLRGRRVAPLLVLGIVQPVVYFLCESYGISLTNSTFAGVIIAVIPIAALGMGALFLNEKPTRAQVAFSLLSIAGVILMTLMQSAEGEIRPLGVVLLFGAVLSGVVFNMISRRISDRYSAFERTYVMMLIAAVSFTVLAVISTKGDMKALLAPAGNMQFIMAIVYLSIVSSVLAFLMLNYANNYLPVAKTTAFCNITTVISLFAGVVFLGEPFGLMSLLASGMIILGIWGVQKGQ
ncbi:MAG: DMT family transporter [Clostridia bacterium]|nr:DMT family transporter [Clostridia bacterium]